MYALLISTLIVAAGSDHDSSNHTRNLNHGKMYETAFNILIPRTELSIGFQATAQHDGEITSQLRNEYQDKWNQFHAFNIGIGFYFGDILGFGYERSLSGTYSVPYDGAGAGRDYFEMDYAYSQWLIGARINPFFMFNDGEYSMRLGYTRGFIHSIYECGNPAVATAIIGDSVSSSVGILGDGTTDNYSIEIAYNYDSRRRSFMRVGYNQYHVRGYSKHLEYSSTIHLSFGVVIF